MKFYNNFNDLYNSTVQFNTKSIFNGGGCNIESQDNDYVITFEGIPFLKVYSDESTPILFFTANDVKWEELNYSDLKLNNIRDNITSAFYYFCEDNGYEWDNTYIKYKDYASNPCLIKSGMSMRDSRKFATIAKNILKEFESEHDIAGC